MCLTINVSDSKERHAPGIRDFFCTMTIAVDEHSRVPLSPTIDSDGSIFRLRLEHLTERV